MLKIDDDHDGNYIHSDKDEDLSFSYQKMNNNKIQWKNELMIIKYIDIYEKKTK